MFLEISQNSQENTCTCQSFFFSKDALGLKLYFKKGLWHRCFPVNFVKFLRTLFCIKTPLVAASDSRSGSTGGTFNLKFSLLLIYVAQQTFQLNRPIQINWIPSRMYHQKFSKASGNTVCSYRVTYTFQSESTL